MAYRICLVCGNVEPCGVLADKRIRKTTCSDFCKTVLIGWAHLPDPKPSIYQHYLNVKHPEQGPHLDVDDDFY